MGQNVSQQVSQYVGTGSVRYIDSLPTLITSASAPSESLGTGVHLNHMNEAPAEAAAATTTSVPVSDALEPTAANDDDDPTTEISYISPAVMRKILPCLTPYVEPLRLLHEKGQLVWRVRPLYNNDRDAVLTSVLTNGHSEFEMQARGEECAVCPIISEADLKSAFHLPGHFITYVHKDSVFKQFLERFAVPLQVMNMPLSMAVFDYLYQANADPFDGVTTVSPRIFAKFDLEAVAEYFRSIYNEDVRIQTPIASSVMNSNGDGDGQMAFQIRAMQQSLRRFSFIMHGEHKGAKDLVWISCQWLMAFVFYETTTAPMHDAIRDTVRHTQNLADELASIQERLRQTTQPYVSDLRSKHVLAIATGDTGSRQMK